MMCEVKKIGFIGTGVMGASMAGHLLGAGHKLKVFNRTESKAKVLIERGAQWVASPSLMARECDLIFTMLGYPSDVEAVIGKELIPGMERDSMIVDFTTSSPALARELAEQGERKGISIVDAPVSGGDLGAKNAALSIMMGGDASIISLILPYLEKLGKKLVHQGGPGAGQLTKMANQIAVAGSMLGMTESLAYAKKCGLDPHLVLDSIKGGAAGSWSLENLSERVLKGDDSPGFYVKHFIKDLKIALDSAKEMNLDLPGTDRALELYCQLQDRGLGDKGTQSLFHLYS